jgi:hypothetical protein
MRALSRSNRVFSSSSSRLKPKARPIAAAANLRLTGSMAIVKID